MESAENIVLLGSAAWAENLGEESSSAQLVLEQYDREHTALRRYLFFIGLDRETAEDVVQESFLKLHEHLLKGGNRSHLRAWLYRVAHNLARNIQSSFRSSRTQSLPEPGAAAEFPAVSSSAEESLLTTERLSRLEQAMNQLKAAQRNCLLLRAQGFRYREIAEVLDLRTSTVAENVQRGLNRLKELI